MPTKWFPLTTGREPTSFELITAAASATGISGVAHAGYGVIASATLFAISDLLACYGLSVALPRTAASETSSGPNLGKRFGAALAGELRGVAGQSILLIVYPVALLWIVVYLLGLP
jgi:hypothetical protein